MNTSTKVQENTNSTNLPSEIWKDIPEYIGLYQCSNFGNVRGVDRVVNGRHGKSTIKGKILKKLIHKQGYIQFSLSRNGISKRYLAHRLVGFCFIPNPNNFRQINHKNEIKDDNYFKNLEWCDSKYNINYGTCIQRISEKRINGKLSKKVYQYDLNGIFIREFKSQSEASRITSIQQGNISECVKGNRLTAGGFTWK